MRVLLVVLVYSWCAFSAADQQKENARLKTANRALLKALKEMAVSAEECYPGYKDTCPSPSVCHKATSKCVDPIWKVASEEAAVAQENGMTECWNDNDNLCPGFYVCRNGFCALPVLDVKSAEAKAMKTTYCKNDRWCEGFYACIDEKCVLPLLVQTPQTREMAVGLECDIDGDCSGSYICHQESCMLPVLAMNPSEETAVGEHCYVDNECGGVESHTVCYKSMCVELVHYV